MSYRKEENAKEKRKDREYKFDRLPENIRQMGEQPEKKRIYIEDYVMTYMHQIFRNKQEQAIVILVGKKGEGKAADASFVYGAMEIELDILEGNQSFQKETWDKIYELLYEHFQGAQILGWGCGVSMWNSRVDEAVRQIQEKHFGQEGKLLFVEDLNEREERVFQWENGRLNELPGYVIYYEKNPQMQDFMLLGQPKKSFEATYHDTVTANVRTVIQRKEEQKDPKKLITYSAGLFLLLLTILGANLLMQSTRKIDSLEKTIETLSNAATNITEKPQVKESGKVKEALKPKTTAEKTSSDKSAVTVPSPADFATPAASAPASTSLTEERAEQTEATPKTEPTDKTVQKPKLTPSPVPEKTGDKASPVPTAAPKADETAKRTASSYVVRHGDTLSQIVWRQYHSLSCMNMVKKANGIKNGDKIKEGQILILPEY